MFGVFCLCCCLSLLPGLACSIHATWGDHLLAEPCTSPLPSLDATAGCRKTLFAPFCLATLSHFRRLIWRSHEADPLISFPYLRRSFCWPRPPSVSVVFGVIYLQHPNFYLGLKQTYFPTSLFPLYNISAQPVPWHLQTSC